MKAFFNWFLNLFKSNLTLMQIAVEEVSMAVFKNRPQLKIPVSSSVAQIQGIINGGQVSSLFNVPALVKSKILSSLPADQQIILGSVLDKIIGDISSQVSAYLVKQNVTALPDQLKVVSQVLGWIDQIAKV